MWVVVMHCSCASDGSISLGKVLALGARQEDVLNPCWLVGLLLELLLQQ